MSRSRKIILIIGSTLLAGLLFIAFILPIIVRSQLEKQVTRATGRPCTVAAVVINPLTWSAEVRGAKLLEKSGSAVFVSFSSLKLRVSPTSIWRMAPVLAGIRLQAPYFHLVRNSANSYNFTDLLEKPPQKKSTAPARFSFNNIVIDNGRLLFDDKGVAGPQQHRIEQLSIQVPFISNIDYFADRYVDPKLSALVNGAPFSFDGKLKPFAKGLEASVHVNLKKADIPYYAPYFPAGLPVKVNSGELSTALQITHRLVPGEKPDITVAGTLQLKNLLLADKSNLPIVGWKSLDAVLERIGLLTNSYDIAAITINRPELTVARNKQGEWNLNRLAGEKPAAAPAEKESAPPKAAVQPKVLLKSLRLADGVVHLRDDLPASGFATDLGQLIFSLDNFSNSGDLPASYQLSLVTGRGESAALAGNFSVAPLTLSARLKMTELQLEAAYPYLAPLLAEAVRGRADFSCDLAYTQAADLTIEKALLKVRNLQVPFGPDNGIKLPLVTVEGGSLRLKERKVSLARVAVTGGKVELSRDPVGKLSTELLLKPAKTAAKSKPAKGGSAAPFVWKIGKVAINGVDAQFTDNMKEEKPVFSLEKITLAASAVTGPKMTAIPFTLAAGYGKQGKLSASGRLLPAPFRFKGEVAMTKLPLVDIEPYLPEGVNVVLLDGKLDVGLSLDLQLKEARLAGSFRGEGGIHEFHSVDSEEEEDLLKWENLTLDRFSGSLEPFSLNMSGVTLSNYYARVIVNKNGRINLQDLYTPPAKPATAAAGAPPPPVSPSPVQRQSGNVSIESVTLQEGELSFSDYHLNREFSTTMLHLGGRVSGLTSEAAQVADIDLRGNLENHSPLRIIGKINPLRGDLFLDMSINFSEIELSPLTPYSGTYLGYAIDKGKLSLALNYKVDHNKLTAENKVFIDQFTFGNQIESAKATSLPVRLAVALLKDKKGEIHLDLPLTGNTNDPKFSVWGVIGQMLKNLLVKAATSPLAMLQSVFGGKDDFSQIGFVSGSNRLTAAEEGKLTTLARALTERPGLKLEVTGFADRERDPEGYRNELLLKKMKNEKFLATAREKRESVGLLPDSVVIAAEEQSKWLKAVYEKEKFPRPRTVVGTLKSLPDSEMKKLIFAHTVVSEQQLRTLAWERAVTVVNYLVKEGKLPQERIFEKSGDAFAPPTKESAAIGRVEFGVVAR